MPSDFVVRAATEHDLDAVASLLREGHRFHQQALPNIFQEPDAAGGLPPFLGNGLAERDAALLVAERNGEIVGLIEVALRTSPANSLFVPRRYAALNSLIVREADRRTGIGRSLLREAERWAAAEEAQAVELNLWEFNTGALAFYERCGYVADSRKLSKPLTGAERNGGEVASPHRPHTISDDTQRPSAVDAAAAFIARHFPNCLAAFLAGSAGRGEPTPSSDLDIVVITGQEAPFRWATFRQEGWPVEVWVMTPESYLSAFAEDAGKRWTALLEMCRDGIVLRDQGGLAEQIKAEARSILDRGPEPLSTEEMDQFRFDLTSLLEDLEGSTDRTDALLIAGGVFHLTATILLALHRQWFGQLDWLVQTLRELDPAQAQELTEALEALCRSGDKSRLIRAADQMLDRVGGRLFEGQSRPTWWRG